MKEILRRTLSLFLVFVLVVGMVPVHAFADQTEAPDETMEQTLPAPTLETQVTEEPQETEVTEVTEETEVAEEIEETEVTEETEETEVTEETEEIEETQEIPEDQEISDEFWFCPDVDLPDDQILFRTYAESVLYGLELSTYSTGAGETLTGLDKQVYDALRSLVAQVANGSRASTIFYIGQAVDGITPDYSVALTPGSLNISNVIRALLTDLPYDLYWFDKTVGMGGQFHYQGDAICLELRMVVNDYFRQGSNDFQVNISRTGAAKTAAANAAALVRQTLSGSKTDVEVLTAYKDYICANVSYNTAASEAGNFGENSNPWQLIYVFDGDSSTNVVCEGYAKAFQYLCDLSCAQGRELECYTVMGTLDGKGHMWNILRLEGKSYLVDVTNCDEDTVGRNGGLFLVGGKANSDGSYTFLDCIYAYDPETLALWSGTDVLTLDVVNFGQTPEVGHDPYVTYRYLDWHDGGGYEPKEDDPELISELYLQPYIFPGMIFYLNTWDNGTQTYVAQPIVPTSDSPYVRIRPYLDPDPQEPNREYFVKFSFVNTLTAQTVPLYFGELCCQVEIPALQSGFFTSTTPSVETYIHDDMDRRWAFNQEALTFYWIVLEQDCVISGEPEFTVYDPNELGDALGISSLVTWEKVSDTMYQLEVNPKLLTESWFYFYMDVDATLAHPSGALEHVWAGCTIHKRWPEEVVSLYLDGQYCMDEDGNWYTYKETGDFTEEGYPIMERDYSVTLPKGVSYSLDTNTLRLENVKFQYVGLSYRYDSYQSLPTDRLTLELMGKNVVTDLSVYGGLNLIAAGTGTLTCDLVSIGDDSLVDNQGGQISLTAGGVLYNDGQILGAIDFPHGTRQLRSRVVAPNQFGDLVEIHEDAEPDPLSGGFAPCMEVYRIFYDCTYDAKNHVWNNKPVIPTSGSTKYLTITKVASQAAEGEENGKYFVKVTTKGTLDTTKVSLKANGKTFPTCIWGCNAGFFSAPKDTPANYITQFHSSESKEQSFYWIFRNPDKNELIDLDILVDDSDTFTDLNVEKVDDHTYKFTLTEAFLNSGKYQTQSVQLDVIADCSTPDGRAMEYSTMIVYADSELDMIAQIRMDDSDYLFYSDGSFIVFDGEQYQTLPLPAGVSYDPDSNTMTLENASLVQLIPNVLPAATLNLVLNGENRITNAISPDFSAAFSGSGSLDVDRLYFAHFTFSDVTVNANELTTFGDLTINSANVTLRKGLDQAGSVTLNGGSLTLNSDYQGPQPVNNGGILYPQATVLTLSSQNGTVFDPMTQSIQPQLTLETDGLPFVTWTSSNKDIIDPAEIRYDRDQGCYLAPFACRAYGDVTLTATAIDGSDVSGEVTLTAAFQDVQTLSAVVDSACGEGLQPNESCYIQVFSDTDHSTRIQASALSFKSSNTKLLTVDQDGMLHRVGTKTGTVTVTATLKGDPQGRRVSVKVPCIGRQIENIHLEASTTQEFERFLDQDVFEMEFDRSTSKAFKITLTPSAAYYSVDPTVEQNVAMKSSTLKWTTSNSKLATVSVNSKGVATVSVKKGVAGEATITATAKDQHKAAVSFTVRIKDYTPVPAKTTLSLNSLFSTGTQVALTEQWGNAIQDVETVMLDNKGKELPGDDRIQATYENGMVTFVTKDNTVKKGTYSVKLITKTTRGDYPITFKLTVAATKPTLTVKQTGKMDLMVKDNSDAVLTATCKTAALGQPELEAKDFVIDAHGKLAYSESYLTDIRTQYRKPTTKVTVKVPVEGYRENGGYLEKSLTLATKTTAVTLVTDPGSTTLNGSLSNGTAVTFRILDKKTKEPIHMDPLVNLAEAKLDKKNLALSSISVDGEFVTVTLPEMKAGTVNLSLRMDGWLNAVKVTHKVTVSKSNPALKAVPSTLTLNSKLPSGRTARTALTVNQTNVSFRIKEIIKPKNSDALSLENQDGVLVASILDSKTIKKGSYKFTVTANVLDKEGNPAKDAKGKEILLKTTVTLKVVDTLPTLTLSPASVSVKPEDSKDLTVKWSNKTGYDLALAGFDGLVNDEKVTMVFNGSKLTVTPLTKGKTTYTLTPYVMDQGEKVLLKTITLNVQGK